MVKGHAWQRGACVAKGEGMHGEGGHVWLRGMCGKGGMCGEGASIAKSGGMHGEGGHVWCAGVHCKGGCVAGETATAAGGTHLTGMHSCLNIILISLIQNEKVWYIILKDKYVAGGDKLIVFLLIYAVWPELLTEE